MLDRKDLRIGNIISGSQYFDTDEAKDELGEDYSLENEFDFLEIESIEHENSDVSFYLRCLRNDSTNPEIWNRLEPVRLTNDIFKLINWEFDDLANEYASPSKKIFYKSGTIWLNTKDYVEHVDFTELRLNVKYLHELQNVFYILTGKEIDVSGFSSVAHSHCV